MRNPWFSTNIIVDIVQAYRVTFGNKRETFGAKLRSLSQLQLSTGPGFHDFSSAKMRNPWFSTRNIDSWEKKPESKYFQNNKRQLLSNFQNRIRSISAPIWFAGNNAVQAVLSNYCRQTIWEQIYFELGSENWTAAAFYCFENICSPVFFLRNQYLLLKTIDFSFLRVISLSLLLFSKAYWWLDQIASNPHGISHPSPLFSFIKGCRAICTLISCAVAPITAYSFEKFAISRYIFF